MTYWLNSGELTGGETVDIGENELEALATLQDEYNLEPEAILNLCFDGYIWEGNKRLKELTQ